VAWPDGSWVPRASIGAARRAGDTVTTLLRRADSSMLDERRTRRTGIR